MFIIFSNHPSKLWAEDERNAALQYGTIEDLALSAGSGRRSLITG